MNINQEVNKENQNQDVSEYQKDNFSLNNKEKDKEINLNLKSKSFIKKDLNIDLKFENNEDDFYNQQKYISLKKKQKIDSSLISNELLDQSQYKFGLFHNCETVINKSPKFKFEDICFLYYYTEIYNRCPICLEDEYLIPIITKCGHIFCLPCFISYYNYSLNSESKKKFQIKCPLCNFKILNKFQDLAFCEIIQSKKYSSISINSNSDSNENFIKFNLVFRHNYMIYNTYFDSDLKYFDKEYQNLSYSEYNDKITNFSSIFIVFSETLLEYYSLIMNKLELRIKNEFNQDIPLDQNDESKLLAILECVEYLKSLIEKNKIIKTNETNKRLENSNVKKQEKKFFYQEINGDIYFLHPLNYSMLMSEYKKSSFFPTEIKVSFL